MRPHLEAVLLLLILLLSLCAARNVTRHRRQIVFRDDDDDRRISEGRDPSNAGRQACVTPDRRNGRCVRLTSCPAFRRLNYNRLRRFFCGFEGDEPKVCCPAPIEPSPTTRTTRRPTTVTVRTTRRPATLAIIRTTRTTRQPATTRRTPPPQTTRRSTTRRTTRRTTIRPDDSNRIQPRVMPSFLPRECGVSNFSTVRVTGGREAENGSWPWMAVVFVEKRNGAKVPDCGGALVTNRHVITAAHCVVGSGLSTLEPRLVSVRLGEHDLNSDRESSVIDVGVASVKRHEAYERRTYANDIAVLTLSRPVEFNDYVSPVCLPYDSLVGEDLTGKTAFVTGWGTIAFNGPSSPKLMEASFDIQDQELCRRAYERELVITDIYLCAGTIDGTKDACQGDSGGPLNTIGKGGRFYLVGVVSFGKLCATPGYPGVYTRVTEYLGWLAQNLRN